MTETKEEFKIYYKKMLNNMTSISQKIEEKLYNDKHVFVENLSFIPNKDYSSTEINFTFMFELTKQEGYSSMGIIASFLEDLEAVKDFMEEEFNYYFEDIDFSENHMKARFNVSRENVDKHALIRSLLGLKKFNL